MIHVIIIVCSKRLVGLPIISGFIFFQEAPRDVPSLFDGHRQSFSSKVFFYPQYVFLIFVPIEGASGVDENAAWLETVPDVADDFSLELPTVVHIAGAPFLDGSLVLPKHTLARARYIGEDDIKLQLGFLVISRIVVGDDDIGMTEFLNVLCQDLRTGAHRFIAEE